jgi:hypothetical protein
MVEYHFLPVLFFIYWAPIFDLKVVPTHSPPLYNAKLVTAVKTSLSTGNHNARQSTIGDLNCRSFCNGTRFDERGIILSKEDGIIKKYMDQFQ